MRAAAALLLLPTVAACTPSSRAGAAERVAALNKIADDCELPRGALKLVGGDHLQIQPPAGSRFEAVDCALAEIRKADFPLKIGFVGNEAPVEAQEN
jgi:hypothetical protein